jgi:hydrogenase nickel incorporation protein HypA/HybF
MHERSLLKDLMNKIGQLARENNARKVIEVKVKLGALSHISADHLRDHFTESTRGTVAENAVLVIERLTDETDPQAQDIILDSIKIAE